MLKTRIIPVLLTKGRELVKGEKFNSWRRVGNTLQAARVHNLRQVDELCILNVSGKPFDLDDVRAMTADTFMPVTIGGGVKTIEQMRGLFNAGADKVAINTAAVEKPELITEASARFGAQSVVVSIDVNQAGHVTTHNGSYDTGKDPVLWAHEAQCLGAGEILLNAIERDGTMQGYDLAFVKRMAEALRVPVIACGGCGTYQHMADAIRAGAHAVAAGALFLFTDQTPQGAARWLHDQGFNTRAA